MLGWDRQICRGNAASKLAKIYPAAQLVSGKHRRHHEAGVRLERTDYRKNFVVCLPGEAIDAAIHERVVERDYLPGSKGHATDRLAGLLVILAAFEDFAPDVGKQRLTLIPLRFDQLAIGEGDKDALRRGREIRVGITFGRKH